MIASPNYSSRGGRAVRLVVIHTAEGALTAQALGNYFAQASSQVSSHVGIDDTSTIQYVDYAYECWAMLSANPISDQAELCAFAAWTRDQWFQHRGMLDQAASWIRSRCQARGIPIRKLTPAEVGAGQAGVCGHWDWTLGTGEGTHTDPGSNFPWDYVIQKAVNPSQPAAGRSREDDTMLIRNTDTGETAILSGGVLTGVNSANADKTNTAAGGALMLGVGKAEWADMLAKSKNFEQLNANFAALGAKLDALTAKL
jgi:hypothetical protein